MKQDDDSRRAYLVNYGQAGYLGRFLAAASYGRGDRVVVCSERGVELGTILCEAGTLGPNGAGEVIRSATDADEGMLPAGHGFRAPLRKASASRLHGSK